MAQTVDLIWDLDAEEPKGLELDSFLDALGKELKLKDWELAIRVVDDETMQATNRDYRNMDRVTDVLSFPVAPMPESTGKHHLGDLLICWPQTLRQAEEFGQSSQVEFRFLILHGLLHLLGYDHEDDAGDMMEFQKKIKKQLDSFFIDGR